MRTKSSTATVRSNAAVSVSILPILWLLGIVSVGGTFVVDAFCFDGHTPALTGVPNKSFDRTFPTTVQRKHEWNRKRCFRSGHRLQSSPRQYHDYTLEADSDPAVSEACTFTEEQIHMLIAKRLDCKKSRNFGHADKIMAALNQNGIHLQDKQRKYRVDGANHFGRRKTYYAQRGGSYGLSARDKSRIEKLIEERTRYKRQRNFNASDDIATVLKEEFGVKVDDRRREWAIHKKGGHNDDNSENDDDKHENTESYVPTPLAPRDHPTHTMSEETKELIRDRLRERSMARRKKAYKAADEILEELMEEHSILVDDRTKEWKVVGASDTFFEEYDDAFAREAQLSQRSAFVQKEWVNPSE